MDTGIKVRPCPVCGDKNPLIHHQHDGEDMVECTNYGKCPLYQRIPLSWWNNSLHFQKKHYIRHLKHKLE